MKSFIFIIQSLNNIITNSSNEVIVTADEDSVGYLKSIIKGVLIGAGVGKDPDELFTFEICNERNIKVLTKDNNPLADKYLGIIEDIYTYEASYNY